MTDDRSSPRPGGPNPAAVPGRGVSSCRFCHKAFHAPADATEAEFDICPDCHVIYAAGRAEEREALRTKPFHRSDGTWSCTRDDVAEPCGDCSGCRLVVADNHAERSQNIRAEEREACARLAERIKALEKLNAYYRTGSRPPDKFHDDLARTKAAADPIIAAVLRDQS